MAVEKEGLGVELSVTEKALAKQLARIESKMARTATRWEKNFAGANSRAVSSMRKVDDAIDSSAMKMQRFGVATAAAFGVTVGFAGIQRFTREVGNAVNTLSEIAKVADRISIDVEVFQGLERGFTQAGVKSNELNGALAAFGRRVGEATTGGGELLKWLKLYDVSVRDANGEMKSQIDLLKEVSEVIRLAGSDQERLAIAQAAFSESGRKMVTALSQGARGIEKMITEAREMGLVLDEDLVRKAEELDDRFNDLTRRMSTWFKRVAVDVADLAEKFINLGDAQRQAFLENEAAHAVGSEIAETLSGDPQALKKSEPALRELAALYDDLATQVVHAKRLIGNEVPSILDAGLEEQGRDLANVSDALGEVAADYLATRIEGEEFEATLREVVGAAKAAVDELQAVGAVDMSGAVAAVQHLSSVLLQASVDAFNLRNELPGGAQKIAADPAMAREKFDRNAYAAGQRAMRDQLSAMEDFAEAEQKRNALSREQLALQNETRRVVRDAAKEGVFLSEVQAEALAKARMASEADRRGSTGGGGGGGVSGGPASEVLRLAEREIDALERRIALIGAEEGEIARLSASTAMLNAAKEKGLDLDERSSKTGMTLREQIKARAEEISNLAEIEDQMKRIQSTSESMEQATEDFFVSIVSGATSAQDALSNLLRTFGNMALKAAFSGVFGGTFDSIADIFTGRAGGGAVRAGQPYLVNERTPNSEVFVPSQNGAILNVGQAQAALRGAGGGGMTQITFAPTIDATGADQAAVDRLEGVVTTMARDFEARVLRVVKSGQDNRMLKKVFR